MFKIDVRSVIIVAILAFGAGAYTAGDEPSYASTTASQSAPSPPTASAPAAAAPAGK